MPNPLDFDFISPADKLEMKGKNWHIENPRPVMLLVYGYGEHCGRYHHAADFFNQQQLAFISFDIHGHGLSSGELDYTRHVNDLFDDLEYMVEKIHHAFHPDVPLIIYGHVTGSALCFVHLIRRPQPGSQAMIL
ncbi:unnamed protein product [Didymodactylos carnosus]|uniref:Serine aminopeptidase S33 domain-containing protein n=1 Tax=Didymodactylos carnosus TaxID=1234261 RepID=A0A8S2EZH9_9BILA|nr:unnamed protein product [Didymodactylos carnosus]CAF4085457.1 unnamed protein product [Didymodactylos carnosus]